MANSDLPQPFGYKLAWFAIHTRDAQAIIDALGLASPRPSTWQEGLDAVYEGPDYHRVFLTPPISGWTLVVGQWAEGWADGYEPLERLICKLSERYGEAQQYATHRVSDYQAWIVARNGKLIRSFSSLTFEILRNEGEQLDIERELRIHPYWPKDPDAHPDEVKKFKTPNETDVMAIAGALSVDPSSLNENTPAPGPGILANIPEDWRPKLAYE